MQQEPRRHEDGQHRINKGGQNLSPRLQAAFGATGRLLLVGFGILAALLVVTEWLFSTMLQRLVRTVDRLWRRLWRVPVVAPAGAADLGGAPPLDDREATPARSRRNGRQRTTAGDGVEDEDLDDDEREGGPDPRRAAPAAGPSGARRRRQADADLDDDEDDGGERDGDPSDRARPGARAADAPAGRSQAGCRDEDGERRLDESGL